MNKIYRVIWSSVQQAFVVADEKARSCKKSKPGASRAARQLAHFLLLGALGGGSLLFSSAAFSSDLNATTLPVNGQVSAGVASIFQQPQILTVQQSSQRAAINWQSFSIGNQATVNFQQPNTSAVTLNRVTGTERSVIDGALRANGQVFLLNSNGLLFTKGAQVNVGGLVASSLDMSDADFMAGKSVFSGNGSHASVVNLGTIHTAEGGYAALLGNQVKNEGVITARLGSAILAAGDRVSLNFNGDSLVSVSVDKGVLNALVENKNAVMADGGLVVLTAKGADQLLATVVNNTGEVRAQTVAEKAGRIYLLADKTTDRIEVGGKLDASAPVSGNGGFIETSAAKVQFKNDLNVTTQAKNALTGLWLIDPTDFNIAANGGDMTGTDLGALLGNNSITIETQAAGNANGDINVNDPVAWNANTALTLKAHNNINVNADITGQSAIGRVVLKYGQGAPAAGNLADYNIAQGIKINLLPGNNFDTKLGSDGSTINWTVVNGLGNPGDATIGSVGPFSTLQGIGYSTNLTGNYVLGADIDASVTGDTNSVWGTSGFLPIAGAPAQTASFTGKFDGLGHAVSNLIINNSDINIATGLFGRTSGTQISNLNVSGNITSVGSNVGGIIGRDEIFLTMTPVTSLKNLHFSGAVSTTEDTVGGIIGQAADLTIKNSTTSGTVSGNYIVGGLIGYLSPANNASVSNSSSSANITGVNASVGGLFGEAYLTNISNSFATGIVTGGSYLGGLIGYSLTNIISESYATGIVNGAEQFVGSLGQFIGGLIGYNDSSTLNKVYATGDVNGVNYAGGLIGYSENSTINQSYATGTVNGRPDYIGGLIGYAKNSTITESYAAGNVIGSTPPTDGNVGSGGLIGLATGVQITGSYATGMVAGNYASGGLIGFIEDNSTVNQSYATGNVNGAQYTGGLIGNSDNSTINLSHATGTVNGASNYTGGLIGYSYKDTLNQVYATGNVSGTENTGGLIGYSDSAEITQSHATGTVNGTSYTGGLIGYNDASPLNQVYATGNVSGTENTGGLIGYSDSAEITQSHATGTVNGTSYTGGLIGYSYENNLNQIYATGNVTGSGSNIGGLLGYSEDYSIARSYATGNVTGDFNSSENVGGLIGKVEYSPITESYATGQVTGYAKIGGLIGYDAAYSSSYSRKNIYATGSVTGQNMVGGLIGDSDTSNIENAYSAGMVTGEANTGGFIGRRDAGNSTIVNSFWDINSSGQPTVAYYDYNSGLPVAGSPGVLEGKTTAQMHKASQYRNAGWSVVAPIAGPGYPTLLFLEGEGDPVWQTYARMLDVSGVTIAPRFYDGTTSVPFNTGSLTGLDDGDLVDLTATTPVYDNPNAGIHNVLVNYTLSGMNADDYMLTNPMVTYSGVINKKPLTINGTTVSNKTYDRTNTASIMPGTLFGLINGENISVAADGTFGDMNAGTHTVTANYTLADGSNGLASNYSLDDTFHTAMITPRMIGVSPLMGASLVYDGTTLANSSLFQLDGVLDGDALMLTGNAWLAGRNVGAQQIVSISDFMLNNPNYVLSEIPPSGSIGITPRPVSVSAPAGANRFYDRTANAQASLLQIDPETLVNGDMVTLSGYGVLESANVGAHGFSDWGTLALNNSNYQFASLPTGQVMILPRTIEVSPLMGASRVYDGTTLANSSLFQLNGVLDGDALMLTGNAWLAGRNVGAQQVASITGFMLNNPNYVLSQIPPSGSIGITPRLLSAAFAAQDKLYDGNTTASASVTEDNRVAGDELILMPVASFADKNVGMNKPVTVGEVALSGRDAGNYIYASTKNQPSATIMPRPILYGLSWLGAPLPLQTQGNDLYTAPSLSSFVQALFRNTVGSEASPLLTYTIWQQGLRVAAINAPGTYIVRPVLSESETRYVLDQNNNQNLSLAVVAVPEPISTPEAANDLSSVIARAIEPLPSTTAPASRSPLNAETFRATVPNVRNPSLQMAATFGGDNMSVVAHPSAQETAVAVTLAQASDLMQGGSAASQDNISVPANSHSLLQIVNGGVKLPDDVSQLLFVVKNESADATRGREGEVQQEPAEPAQSL